MYARGASLGGGLYPTGSRFTLGATNLPHPGMSPGPGTPETVWTDTPYGASPSWTDVVIHAIDTLPVIVNPHTPSNPVPTPYPTYLPVAPPRGVGLSGQTILLGVVALGALWWATSGRPARRRRNR